jgi:hypothetical protein
VDATSATLPAYAFAFAGESARLRSVKIASDHEETVREASLRASVAFARVVESICVGQLAAEIDKS